MVGFWNGPAASGATSDEPHEDPPPASGPAKELADLLSSALASSSSAPPSAADGNAEERAETARRLSSLLTGQAQSLAMTSGREGGGYGEVGPTLLRQRRQWIPLLLGWTEGSGADRDLDFDLGGGGAGGPGVNGGGGRRGGRGGGRAGGTAGSDEVQIESLRALAVLARWTDASFSSSSSSSSPPPLAPPSIHAPLPSATQRILMRHADSVPLLVSLLSSPDPAVHERAMWMLGSLAGSTMTGAAAPANDTVSLAREITDYMSGGGKGDGTAPASLPSGGGQDQSAGDANSSSNPDGAPSGSARRDRNLSPRDVIFAACGLRPILACLDARPDALALHRLGAWCLSNLVEGRYSGTSCVGDSSGGTSAPSSSSSSSGGRGKPCAADEIDIFAVLPTLRRMLHYDDDEVLTSTCWTLSHLCDGPAYHISAVIYCAGGMRCLASALSPRNGLIPRLVELLLHPNPKVGKPALRAVGNVVCADCTNDHGGRFADRPHLPIVDFTEIILDCGAVPRLRRLIGSPSREIQKEACWTLSNIAAGTSSQIEAVLASGAVPPLAAIVNDPNTDKEVRSEACWVVLNATSCGNDSQIRRLIGEGCVGVLGVLLGESNMVMMALEGLERVLQSEEARAADDDARRAASAAAGGGVPARPGPPGQRPTILEVGSLVRSVCESTHNSNAVMKRARRIWDGHFVSCALCQTTYSYPGRGWGGHYGAGGAACSSAAGLPSPPPSTHFCTECKCHVCYQCDCRVYHLSYQEELWQQDEEQAEKGKAAKKSKKQRKKEKERAKKEKRRIEAEASAAAAQQQQQQQQQQPAKSGAAPPAPPGNDGGGGGGKDELDESESAVDLVSYLQQTGSIIALAKLLDSLYEHERLDEDESGQAGGGGGGGGKARSSNKKAGAPALRATQ